MKKANRDIPYEIVDGRNYIWKTPIKIETFMKPIDRCPHCGAALILGFSLVSVGGNGKAKVIGFECKECKILFAQHSNAIRKLLKDNVCSKEITLNGKYLWNYSELQRRKIRSKERAKILACKREILSRINGSIMLVILKNDNKQIDCVITGSKKVNLYDGVIVTHYTSILAKEILTSVYREPRIIDIGGDEYCLTTSVYPLDEAGRQQVFPIELMPSAIKIKQDGGYFTAIRNDHEEVVDVLLFSLCTHRYEIARATYDSVSNECFMDIGIFRSYVKEYGKPELQLRFNESTRVGTSFDDLRAESILHAYGYSASKADGLTESERRELLSEIVDLELLTVSYVVRLLDYFIRIHPSDKDYIARDKWKRDIKFISNYNINTKRFLIMR